MVKRTKDAITKRNIELLWLPAKLLKNDRKYQRVLDQHRINKIIREYELRKVNPVRVSKVHGVYHVIDGQHTIAANVQLFGPDVQLLCYVYEGMTYEEEAALFSTLDKLNRKLNALAQYNTDLEARKPDAVAINAVVKKLGLIVSNHRAPNVINAITEVRKVHSKHDNLERVLTVCKKAWTGHDPHSVYDGRLVRGVAYFLDRFPGADDTQLIAKLKRVDPILLVTSIVAEFRREGGDIGVLGAKLIRLKYNKRLKKQLPPVD